MYIRPKTENGFFSFDLLISNQNGLKLKIAVVSAISPYLEFTLEITPLSGGLQMTLEAKRCFVLFLFYKES